jgi:chorismate mutase
MAKFALLSGLPEAWQTCGVCKAQIGAEFAVSIAQRAYAETQSATSAAMLAEALVRNAGDPVRIAKLFDRIMEDEASVGEQRLTRLRLATFEYLISTGYMHASHDALRDYMGVRWYHGVSRTDEDPVRRMQLSASGLVRYVIGTREDGPSARTALSMSEHSLRIALDLAKERRPDGTYNSSKDERVLLRRRLARTLCAQPSRAEEGVRILRRVCKAEQTRLGHDHPRTREVMAELARACASPSLGACTSPVAEDEEDDEFVHSRDPRLKPSLDEMMRRYSEITVDVDGSGRYFRRESDSRDADARLYRAMRNDPTARLADFSY